MTREQAKFENIFFLFIFPAFYQLHAIIFVLRDENIVADESSRTPRKHKEQWWSRGLVLVLQFRVVQAGIKLTTGSQANPTCKYISFSQSISVPFHRPSRPRYRRISWPQAQLCRPPGGTDCVDHKCTHVCSPHEVHVFLHFLLALHNI